VTAVLEMLPASRPPGKAGGAAHVLGARAGADAATARLAALIEPAFLAEAGWDRVTRVLSLPPGHPLLGWRACPVPGCVNVLYGPARECGTCRHAAGRRPAAGRHGDSEREDEGHGDALAAPAAGRDLCGVQACSRDRGNRRYCRAHYERVLKHRRADPLFDEKAWQVAEDAIRPPVEGPGQVSLHGVAAQAVVEMLYGLQQRTRTGTTTDVARLRQVAAELRDTPASALADLDADGRTQHKLTRCFLRHVARAFLDPETETRKDVWDLAVFGQPGRLTFTKISQRWLREAAKRWAADDLPRRRGKVAAGPLRHYLTSLALLSDSLRSVRPGHEDDPALLSRADIEGFLHRLAFLAGEGRISADARTRTCREVRHLLGRFRALGLTRPGGPAAGLADDFALSASDIPVKPDDPEAGRDLPPEIMRQLCQHLAELEDVSCREVRVAAELVIDTGRRPDEICALPWDCLEYDEPGHLPVLVYFNHKSARQGRRLPIAQATADLIVAQKTRVREQFPATPLTGLKLLPAAYANPHGRRAITEGHFGARHRTWAGSLPPLLRSDGTEFDKARVIPYAYRHTYAQRHADAGVPVDVLGTLMDHRSLDTTRHYYSVGESRRRDAVDKVAALQFDRHGNRVWRDAKALLDSEHARRAIGEVVVPFGTCSEPSNVQAGGRACPYRFRCTGCDHFSTDVSYLPDLHAYLDDLLRNRERVLSAADVEEWARAEAAPSHEEITSIRRLISRIENGMDELTAAEREQVDQAIAIVRRHRTVALGMPRLRQALPGIRPERSA
jgi:integrase